MASASQLSSIEKTQNDAFCSCTGLILNPCDVHRGAVSSRLRSECTLAQHACCKGPREELWPVAAWVAPQDTPNPNLLIGSELIANPL